MLKTDETKFTWKTILNLIEKFFDLIDKIPNVNTNVNDMISVIITIDLEKSLMTIQKHFHRIEKREELMTPFKSFRSISKDNNYVSLRSVVGCSSSVKYNERKFVCVKRFFNMMKKPIVDYLGSDLIFPVITLINTPFTELLMLK